MFEQLLNRLNVSKKFAVDNLWSVISLGVIGINGVLLNLLISKYYGAAALGVFNQVYAIYIFFSQAAVFGFHLSVLTHIPKYSKHPAQISNIMTAALTLVMISGICAVWLYYLSRRYFADLLDSADVGTGMMYAAPGLFAFALNKVLFAYQNAKRDMGKYAVLQAVRFILLSAFLILLISLGFGSTAICSIFSFAEILLFIVLSVLVLKDIKPQFTFETLVWIQTHFRFASRAFWGNMLIDINTRIDVLILGIFVPDRSVGIYSFAAMLADGFNQLALILRTNVNPVLARYSGEQPLENLRGVIEKGKRITYGFFVPLGLIAIFSYPVVIELFSFEPEFFEGWIIFSVLVFGIMLAAGYLPFQMMFNQLGHPAMQTVFLSLIFFSNVILNFCLIPWMGILGAAIATSTACAVQIIFMKLLSNKLFGRAV